MAARNNVCLVATAEQFCAVAHDAPGTAVIITTGVQGPPGPSAPPGAVAVSPDPENQIKERPNGLYSPPPAWAEKEW